MRLATWNVNGLRARLDFLRIWLLERRPDVVGLQELKLDDEEAAREAAAAAGYDALVHGQRGWNGVAILVRQGLPAPRETARGLPGQEAMGARLLGASIGDLSFTTLYVPNGKSTHHDDFPRKLAWLDALAAHLEGTADPDRPAVVCGDFNLCPTGLDSWNEEALAGTIFHTDEERERYRRLVAAGLRDVLRERRPGEKVFSWWDYRGGAFHRGHGLRIDLLLGTPPVVDRLETAAIDRDYRKKIDGLTASDHAPVVADLA